MQLEITYPGSVVVVSVQGWHLETWQGVDWEPRWFRSRRPERCNGTKAWAWPHGSSRHSTWIRSHWFYWVIGNRFCDRVSGHWWWQEGFSNDGVIRIISIFVLDSLNLPVANNTAKWKLATAHSLTPNVTVIVNIIFISSSSNNLIINGWRLGETLDSFLWVWPARDKWNQQWYF